MKLIIGKKNLRTYCVKVYNHYECEELNSPLKRLIAQDGKEFEKYEDSIEIIEDPEFFIQPPVYEKMKINEITKKEINKEKTFPPNLLDKIYRWLNNIGENK